MKKYSRKEFLDRACRYSLALLPSARLAAASGEASPVQILPDSAGQSGYEPSYLKLQASGELKARGESLWNSMRHCELCPRECHENRLRGEKGECGSTEQMRIGFSGPQFGDDFPLAGSRGSGAIVMANCSLRCVFCSAWQYSHGGTGKNEEIESLALIMLGLQERGCHNLNVVTPTHYLPHVLLALDAAASRGLRLPLVFSTGGWEKSRILRRLEGIVDVYLSDFKFFDPAMAARYSEGGESYPEITRKAVLEMHRQVGVAKPDPDGMIRRGLMLRHLVMPGNVGGTGEIVSWIAENLSKDTYLSLMSWYRPEYKASKYAEISRRLDLREYRKAVSQAREAGLTNLVTRES